MTSRFVIRLATAKELETIADIHVECFAEIGQTREAFLSYAARPDVHTRAAFEGDRIVGYATSVFREGRGVYLAWFGVTASERGSGAGKALYKDLYDFAVLRKAPAIELTSRNRFRKAAHFYTAHGFEIYGLYVGMDKDIMLEMRVGIPQGS